MAGALQWQGIPTDSRELILFAMNAAPVEGRLFFDWAVAGLSRRAQRPRGRQAAQGRGGGPKRLRQNGL